MTRYRVKSTLNHGLEPLEHREKHRALDPGHEQQIPELDLTKRGNQHTCSKKEIKVLRENNPLPE
jgi:hypothetical protein